MKCEHCGKNDATFYYKSNINGKISEVHLCPDCAEKLGYTEKLHRSFHPMGLFSDPFAAFEPLFGALGSRLLTEFPAPVEEKSSVEVQPLVAESELQNLRQQRQRNALQAQLKSAVEAEDYETAAKLRDELKRLSA